MSRILGARAYPLWKLSLTLLALLALLAAGQSMLRVPGGHVQARAATAPADGDPIYMQYGTIQGDVTASGFAHQIELNSFSFGVHRAISSGVGGAGREASAPSVSEISITKVMDVSSPQLFEESVSGEGQTAVISFVRFSAGVPDTYLKVTLENTLVSSFSMSSGGDRPTESLTLNFTKITLAYKNSSGSDIGSVTTVGYDLALARAF